MQIKSFPNVTHRVIITQQFTDEELKIREDRYSDEKMERYAVKCTNPYTGETFWVLIYEPQSVMNVRDMSIVTGHEQLIVIEWNKDENAIIPHRQWTR